MSWGDRITVLVAAGAIAATVGVGTCSTSARFGEVRADMREVRDEVRALRDDVQDLGERVTRLEVRLEAGGQNQVGAGGSPTVVNPRGN